MVFQLLAFGGRMTEYGPAAEHQVGTGVEQAFIDHEIFLFPSQGGRNLRHILVEIVANVHGCLVQGCKRLEQGSFVVQRLAGIRYEDGRDAKSLAGSDLHYKSRRGRIPGSITTSFEGSSQTAAGEGRSIGLLLDQGSAVEFFDGGSITLYGKERIVFFSSSPGQRLEPVGEVSYTLAFSPLTQAGGNLVGDSTVNFLAALDRRYQALVGLIA